MQPAAPGTDVHVTSALGVRAGGCAQLFSELARGLRRLCAPARLPLAVAALSVVAFAFGAAPAFAAAPEVPEALKPEPLFATVAYLHGVADPKLAGGPGTFEMLSYEFLYKESKTECKAGSASPAGLTFGEGHEALPRQEVSGLKPAAEYTVCLRVSSIEGEAVSPKLTFKTAKAAPPEPPEATGVENRKATSAELVGVISPLKEGEPGHYRFLYRQSASECKGAGEVETPEELASRSSPQPVSAAITGLEPGKPYTFCVKAFNALGEATLSTPNTFTAALPPETPEATSATAITGTTAKLNGLLNPKSPGEAGEYEFRYRASSTECEGEGEKRAPEPPASSTGGKEELASTEVTGLLPATQYTFCLFTNNLVGETAVSPTATFTTPTSVPAVTEAAFSSVGSTTATLSALINPGGVSTTYRVEYGTSVAYGSLTPDASAGAGSAAVSVQVLLSALQPETVYHARFVATNELGTTPGGDLTFTTSPAPGGSASALPDNRVYELASPAGSRDVYVPLTDFQVALPPTSVYTLRPSRASVDGNAVAYVAEPPTSGGSGSQGSGLGESYLAVRTPQGWTASDIVPPGATLITQYVGLSSDLSVGVLQGLKTTGAAPCDEFVARKEGLVHAFFTEQPSGAICVTSESSFDGASADYSHLLFESQAALVPGAEEAAPGQYNLYDSVNGQLHLINVLPDGKSAPNATFGGPHGAGSQAAGFTNAISTDGSRIFWTDLNTGRLYLRINGTVTVPVSAGAATSEFWTATPDGRYVFYTEGEGSSSRLWRFAVDRFEESSKPEAQALMEAREELTGEGAGVLGVIGVNETGEDGAYVYFVAEGILASNANSNGDTAANGAPNLYVRENSETKFVATLSPEDNHVGEGVQRIGAWEHNLGDRSSEVTPDGHSVGFVSSAHLTGYDNRGLDEVYVYDSPAGQLLCASCNSTGLPPAAGAQGAVVPASFNTSAGGSTYLLRWLSEDGSRVFFDTSEPLLPQVTDGQSNVYEWERQGKGSCAHSTGCMYVLSGGGSPDGSYLVDASANGDDVFFASSEELVPGAGREAVKLYDARVGGGFPGNSTACTGTGCQGVPPAPATFATPSSVTFNGAGNFQAPTPAHTKKKTAAQVRAEKLAKALRACSKKPKRQRSACKRQARRKYAPVKKRGRR
jgi:hypothetical protein